MSHQASALLTGSEASGPQEGTIYWVHPASTQPGLPSKAGLGHWATSPQRQKPSAQGKLDFTSLCPADCFGKLHIPEQSFGIYPNCSVRRRTEPSRYVCLGWSVALLFSSFLQSSEHIFESTWKYIFIFLDDLHLSSSTWTEVLTFFPTCDWSYERKEQLVNITHL